MHRVAQLLPGHNHHLKRSMDSLISFKAGLANFIEGVVTPDPRRGEVRVIAVEADGLLHFQWCERKSSGPSDPEIDIVIFPEEADFVKDVQPGARVLQLRFKDESRKHLFFWMQESDPSRDAELCQLVQEAINMGDEGGASASELGSRSAVFEAAEISGKGEVSSREPGGVQASDLARILAGMNVPPAAGGLQAAAAASAADPAVSPEYLASILAGMVGQSGAAQPQLPSLAEILTPQNLVPLLQKEGPRRRLGELVEHLPREHQEEAAKEPLIAVTEALRSAPLQNQLRTLSHALASGQLDYSQFGLQPLGYSAADFLQSIQNKADSEKEEEER